MKPNRLTPPRNIIRRAVKELGWTLTEFYIRMGYKRTPAFMSDKLDGKLTAEIAIKLETVLDVLAVLWMNLEASYRLGLARGVK